jgi:hypothetical protein
MQYVKLQISLKRVQSFIFAVPRLKAMVGANALIGDTLRHELTKALGTRGAKLAWPQTVHDEVPLDPLDRCGFTDGFAGQDPRDHPARLFGGGILARDGGHFIALFGGGTVTEAEMAAVDFRAHAERILAERLPGVLFDADIAPFRAGQTENNEHGETKRREPFEVHLLDLPVLQVCQETGTEAASRVERREGRSIYSGASVARRIAWGDKFYAGLTRDLVGLLRDQLYPDARMGWVEPMDLTHLAGGDYLALIHADGNAMGQRYNGWRANATGDALAREAHGEVFFHSMRVAVRRALIAALETTFTAKPAATSEGCRGARPYEILMLGGDDLLLVCRAEFALGFARRYACALESHKLADGRPPDVAIGVAIARHTYPLHRLNELAEALAGSAKRLYRALPNNSKTSVVDWQVVTESFFEDLAHVRRRADRVCYRVNGKDENAKEEILLLSARPYTVCGADRSLDALLRQANLLAGTGEQVRAARSPLRALRAACERGRRAGDVWFARLPAEVRNVLGGSLWEEVKRPPVWITRALDAVDVLEIGRLGSREEKSHG